MTGPISPAPVTEWRPDFLPAYLSNGLIGLRVGPVPTMNGNAMVSGVEGLDPETGLEAAARAPYPIAGDVRIGRVALSEPGRAKLTEQRYDFTRGELHTRLTLDGDGVRAELEFVTLCSRTQPTLVLQELRVRVDNDCDLTISGGVDARDVLGGWEPQLTNQQMTAVPTDEAGSWRTNGGIGSCGVAYRTDLLGADGCERRRDHDGGRVTTAYSFRGRAGQRYVLRQMTSLVSHAMHSQPHMQAVRLVGAGRLRGFDQLRQDNARRWAELWRGRLVLTGAPRRWQALIDAAFYYLISSTHGSSPSSTSVFGLAYWPNYHYYRGHLLWDIETFALPPLLLLNPEAARALLRYRGSRLPAACANAIGEGYAGAKYPWESSLRHGHEAAPLDTDGPSAEHHVSMDVAIAFARYVHATGDREFARDEAWPVLFGVARWLEDRAEPTSRGYEILRATGIAEAGRLVNNSAFVNMTAVVALREAAALGHSLGRVSRPAWERIAQRLVLPIDPVSNVIRNHDDYDPAEPKGETPEDAAVLFPLGFRADPRVERSTYEFYLRLADKYAGTPMLSAMLGVYAARLGDRAAALDLFEKGYGQFIIEPYTVTTEYAPAVYPDMPRAGPFSANLGGFITGCLYGLTGMRLNESDPAAWFERPVVMPEGWDAIEIERVWARGEEVSMLAEHGATQGQLAIL